MDTGATAFIVRKNFWATAGGRADTGRVRRDYHGGGQGRRGDVANTFYKRAVPGAGYPDGCQMSAGPSRVTRAFSWNFTLVRLDRASFSPMA